MLPLLYETTDPILAPGRMRYLGRLCKCEKCVSVEKLNGDYTLSAVFSPTDELIGEVQNQRFLTVKPNPFDQPQYFEIYNCGYDGVGRLSVSARHIKHCCYNNIVISDVSHSAQYNTPAGHWDFCTQVSTPKSLEFENNFTFSCTISEIQAMEIGYTKSDTLGAFLNEMANAFNAEFHYDNFNISLLAARGSRKNYVLRWDKNIGSPSLTLGAANVYTHVVAYADLTAKYTVDGTDYEYPVQICSSPRVIDDFIHNGSGRLAKIFMYNATDTFEEKNIDPTQGENYRAIKARLNWLAAKYILRTAGKGLQIAESVNLKVNFRPALDEMTAVGLGDVIDVALKGGRTAEAKITKTEYDCLAERWNGIELGEEKLKLSNYIARKN